MKYTELKSELFKILHGKSTLINELRFILSIAVFVIGVVILSTSGKVVFPFQKSMGILFVSSSMVMFYSSLREIKEWLRNLADVCAVGTIAYGASLVYSHVGSEEIALGLISIFTFLFYWKWKAEGKYDRNTNVSNRDNKSITHSI